MRIVRTVFVALAACLAVQGSVRADQDTHDHVPVVLAPSLRPDAHMHPPYPSEVDGKPARVLLEITIDAEGHVEEATVLSVDRDEEQAARIAS